jgi:hypothetical protein
MQDRICQVDETLLQRMAGPYIGSFSDLGAVLNYVSSTPVNGHCPKRGICPITVKLRSLDAQPGGRLHPE